MINELYILNIVSFLLMLSAFYFLFKIPKCEEFDVRIDEKVSIIIPARNEEHNIGKLLDSLNDSDELAEIIVINDASADRTREIAISKGAMVIDSKKLADGWFGKPWALNQGALDAKNNLLLFLDADIELEKDGLRKIISTFLYKEHQLKLSRIVLSIAPYHKIKEFYEQFSGIFNIIMTGSMNAFTPNPKAEINGLFGQSLMIRKHDYLEAGGHEPVKNKILENMFLAEKYKSLGYKLLLFGGKGSLSFRMYPAGFAELINGWSKAFASGAARIPFSTLILIILWISGGFIITIVPFWSFLQESYSLIGSLLYWFYIFQFYRMLKMTGNFSFISALAFPMHLIFFVIIFSRSLYLKLTKRAVKWKMRDVSS